jgi:SPOR domain
MAHSQHAKIPKLNALLIGKRTVPGGCRVLHVSQQGMSLQCDPDGRLLTFSSGDSVDIYLSVQHANGHNKFTIPAIVSHVDESTIDLVFHCTDPELAGLIESYLTSESHNLEASIDHRQAGGNENRIKPVAANEGFSYHERFDTATSQSSRPFYAGLLILFFTSLVFLGAYYYVSSINTRLNALETVTRSHSNELAEVQTQAFSSRLQDGRYASLNARMKALTDAFQSFEKRITEALPRDPLAITATAQELISEPSVTPRKSEQAATDTTTPGDRSRETVVPLLAAPVVGTPRVIADQQVVEEASTASLQKYPVIESLPVAPAAAVPLQTGQESAPAVTNVDEPVETGTTDMPAVEPEPQHASTPVATPAATPTRVADVIPDTGPWVINLLSSRDKAYVSKAMADAQSVGVDVVVASASVKGKQYWRLQIPGFKSMAEAKSAATPVKEKLKIKDVWIFKR